MTLGEASRCDASAAGEVVRLHAAKPEPSIVAEGTVRNARMRVLFRAIDANLGASPNVALETLCPYRLPVSSAQIERVRRHDVLLENDGP